MPPARRGALTALLALGLVVLAAGWVAAGQTSSSEPATYREAVLGRPVRINPLAVPASRAEADLAALLFDGLMRLRADGSPAPELAERWEVTPDGLTYTFHLRPDVTWHDGAAFDAEDVAFTVGRIQAEGFTGPPALRAAWEGVQVFVADPLTVLMRLPEPAADFLVRATLGILPAHRAEEMDAAEGFSAGPFDRSPVGTGPYRLESLGEERAVLRHNTSYFGGTPPITSIELRFAETVDEQLDWLRAGDVDAALLPPEAAREAVATAEAAGRLQATRLTSDAQTVLYLNNQRGVLSDARTRRAVAASIDSARIVVDVGVSAEPAAGVIPSRSWAFEGRDATPEDLDALWTAAQWERDAAGRLVREGEPLTLELVTNGESERIALAEAIAGVLREAGVTVDVVTAPAQRVIADYLRPGAYDLALFGWETPPDPDPYAGWHTSQIGAGNVAGFSDPEADALLEAARTTLDVAERRELYRLFQARFDELGASKVIAHPVWTYVHPAALAGFEPMLLVTEDGRFMDVHRWRLED